MKKYLLFYFSVSLLAIAINSFHYLTAQKVDEVIEEDREFMELLKKVEENNRATIAIQKMASETQTKMVEKTATKIVALKEENKELKVELHETKSKLDSVIIDTGLPFIVLPISHYEGNKRRYDSNDASKPSGHNK